MYNNKKIPVVVIVGPTASGKTKLAVEIAKSINAEIVSFDSMQIYKELSISTAKPTTEEMQGITHQMIGCASVCDDFSVAKYCKEANKIIADISARGKNIVLVGGTGLYIDSLINNISFSNEDDDKIIRDKLQKEYEDFGADYLFNKLRKIDEKSAENTHPNNVKRVIRALEIYYKTGKTKAQQDQIAKENNSMYNPIYIGTNYFDRQKLYDRINMRVDKMIDNGLIDEVKSFYNIKGVKTGLQAIGCKELKPYLDGIESLENCIEKIKQESRRYAKRQITWFKRNDKINWFYFDKQSFESVLNDSLKIINKNL